MAQKNILLTAPCVIPPGIQQMAKEAQLGEPRKVYSACRNDLKKVGIILIITGGVFVGILVLVLILLIILAKDIYGLPGLLLSLELPFLTLGLLFLLPGCYIVFHRGIYPYWHIYLHQNGFVYEKGKLHKVYRWDQISTINGYVRQVEYHSSNGRHTNVTERTLYLYKIHHQDGSEIELNNVFPGVAELIDIVLERSARQLAPREITITDPRHVVIFTNFALDGQGIGNGQEKVSWEEIDEITMKNGSAVVRKAET